MLNFPLSSAGYKQRIDKSVFFNVVKSPMFTYNANGLLVSVIYSDGSSKVMGYIDGVLAQIDSTFQNLTTRKTFNYNAEGFLTSINEVEI